MKITSLRNICALGLLVCLGGCGVPAASSAEMPREIVQRNHPASGQREIYLAGGCFWGTELYLSLVNGVVSAESGYANGDTAHPSYREVCSGSGHAEAVHVVYDPDIISLDQLLSAFYDSIDPTAKDRQGNDVGRQYRSGIYYVPNEDGSDGPDAEAIHASLDALQKQIGKPLAIETGPIVNFYRAEEDHQEYLEKNPNGYCHIDFSSLDDVKLESGADGAEPYGYKDENGRVRVNEAAFSRPDDDEIARMLTDAQYDITQRDGTERAFTGDYFDNKEPGIYVDVVTGEPLFSSEDKFESGCGWPSFTAPIDPDVIVEKTDMSHGLMRTEVRSRVGDSHLGHVFTDGPAKAGGLRYCIDSAALRFIPLDKMEEQGYGIFMDRCDSYGESTK